MEEELALVLSKLRRQLKKRRRFAPLQDIRREAVLCAAHSRLLRTSPLVFSEDMNLDFLNSQLDSPFTLHQVSASVVLTTSVHTLTGKTMRVHYSCSGCPCEMCSLQ